MRMRLSVGLTTFALVLAVLAYAVDKVFYLP
jgi:hypothetical protein